MKLQNCTKFLVIGVRTIKGQSFSAVGSVLNFHYALIDLCVELPCNKFLRNP